MKPETSAGLSLIVSLHDIAPATFETARRQMDELTGLGVTRMSLLVVPYHHRQQRVEDDSRLCEWLRDCQARGHEIVLHGFSHQLDPAAARQPASTGNGLSAGFRHWFLENLYTMREAEFLKLDYDQARSRIETGLSSLRKLGFRVFGFIAPAWLISPDGERAARDLGLLYTNTLTRLIHLPSGQRHVTRSCVWSTRAAWRRTCSLAWNAVMFRCQSDVDPLRISVHPSDLEYPAIWAQVKRLIGSALKNRQPATYAEWISSEEIG